ncbi:alpha/beta hydrolase fold protein [Sphingomonas sp. LH128]|uniref:Alpha/beta hydrolase n=2 Tax=Sphingomonadales TaxID=204457 RepID=A0A031JPT5_9SPHN|nr:alpha/beta hydrolase [Novosphingobium resinovorum]AOR75335.1 alpha/beta hydrolase [Novosphingobium resinovorum]EJU14081.1 alpha/beta hydrolase fold protein [Sphingomonas sp. LH128]EZP74725.1 Alpha/beta hydrolase fold protein [Novosphingobium resinovorum]
MIWNIALRMAAMVLAGSPVMIAEAALAAPSGTTVHAATSDEALLARLPGFRQGFAEVDGVRLHYVEGGAANSGKPALVLLPGWPQTWWSYHKIMPQLARDRRVIAVDLRGMGASSKPAGGYDKKTMAADIAGLVHQLGLGKVDIVGHDIGSMVAYSFAANHSDLTDKLVLLDVAPPDAGLATWPMLPALGTFGDKVGDGSHAYVWWFAYHQVPELHEKMAGEGRIRMEQDWFFHYLTKDEAAIDALDRDVYAAAYTPRDAIRAGDGWYQAFPQDIVDDDGYAPLAMPVLALGGPGFAWLQGVLASKAPSAKVLKVDSGHFIPDEVPDILVEQIKAFTQ